MNKEIDLQKLVGWARQPTTVAGFAASIGTLSALLLGQVSWAQAVPLLIGSGISMLLPDNAGARQAAQTLAQDAVAQLTRKSG